MSCLDTIQAYAFRSLGFGERLLPRTDFTLCEHFNLIGSVSYTHLTLPTH